MFSFLSSSSQCGFISLTEMSLSIGAPPPPPLPHCLHPHSSLLLPLGCKAYKEIGVLCCISSCLIKSLLPNLFPTVLKNFSRNQKVVFVIPEKEQINRYMLYYYAHSLLTPRSVCNKESLDSQELSWLPWKRRAPPPPLPSPPVSE